MVVAVRIGDDALGAARRADGVDELDGQVREVYSDAAGLTHDGNAVKFPEPVKFARPVAFNVLPLAGSSWTTGRSRPTRNRSCATNRARSSISRRCW